MTDRKRRFLWTLALCFAAGVVAGAAIAHFRLDAWFPAPAAEDVAALAIALMLVLAGLYTLWTSADAERFRRLVEKRDDVEPADPLALRTARQSGIVCVLAGAMLAIPPLAAGQDLAQPLRVAAFGTILLLLAAETWINWRIWRDGDELTRLVIVTTGALCFWIGQFALFLWAALAKLALVPDIGSWAILTAWMALYLVASMVVSMRRGFGEFQ